MENKTHAFAAGAFLLVLLGLVAGMAAWLTRDTSEQRIYEISSREGVTGLQPQAGVRYKGVLVGRVSSIELDKQTPGNVLVRIAVNEQAPITTTTFASLGFQGVTGLAFIQLEDPGQGSPVLMTNRTQVARIPMRQGLVSRLSEQGGHLLSQLEQASQKTNALLAAENQKTLMTTIAQLGQAAAQIQTLTRHADQLLLPAPGQEPVNLPEVAAQAQATLKSMQASSERLAGSAESVKASATEFKKMSTRMTESGGTLDRIALTTEVLVATGQQLNTTVLPRLKRTTEDTSRAMRQTARAAETLADVPQSLLFGKPAQIPGPGEPGFIPPTESGK